jgi:acetyl-CoA carboxylase carboxyltransferase component
MDDIYGPYRKMKDEALGLGGPESIEKLHRKGKMTCRERLELLLDPGTFREIGRLAQSTVETPGRAPVVIQADGIVAGWGEIDGRKVYVSADDATIMSGAAGQNTSEKRVRVLKMAMEQRCPIIRLNEMSAMRFQDGMRAEIFAKVGRGFKLATNTSGAVPKIAAMMGWCFGGPAFLAMMSDFVAMVRGTSAMGMSGPPLVRGAFSDLIGPEELGGVDIHYNATGLADYAAETEEACIASIKKYLSFMPASCWELPPVVETGDDPNRRCDELIEIVPTNLKRSYDMNDVIRCIVDQGDFFPLRSGFGQGMITCLARMDGNTVGIVANQPNYRSGVYDWRGCYKARRFISLCDAFHIPLIFLMDEPGFMIGQEEEKNRILYYAIYNLMTLYQATVPKLTVIMRKAYGLAYMAMGGHPTDPDLLVAWPTAEIAVTGSEAAVYTMHQKELEAAENPTAVKQELVDFYRRGAGPDRAARAFLLDDIIDPKDTRRVLIDGLKMAVEKRKGRLGYKHVIYP